MMSGADAGATVAVGLRRRTIPSSRAGTFLLRGSFVFGSRIKERRMHGLIYLIGLIVVILAILSFFGLR
jgi:hypothetical protein